MLLAGGKNVVYKYSEVSDGTRPNVLLVGGYGSNTLTGGTMTFGNFIPADRIAQAKAHFADTTGFDGAGQSLINSVIDAAIAPANPAGIIGATMTGSRGGLMFGGPGNNSFFAAGAGAYEMIGGNWVNSFSISPSFGGVPATYQIDGGSGGDSKLVVRVPADEHVLFENSTIVDKYTPTLKALAVQANAGLSATAHGIQKVHIIATPGASVEIGDTSEVNIAFSIEGGANLRFGGTNAPDQFDIDVQADLLAKKNHFAVQTFMPFDATTIYSPAPSGLLLGNSVRYPDPIYFVTRTFGTNNRTQTIPFAISNADASSIVLDGKGASDSYAIRIGVGSVIDVTVDDSDATTQNTLTVNFRDVQLFNQQLVLTDNQLHFEYFTAPIDFGQLWLHAGNWTSFDPGIGNSPSYSYYSSSVFYSPTVFFGANTDITLNSASFFQETIVNRPVAPQNATIRRDEVNNPPYVVFGSSAVTVGFAYDPESANPSLIAFDPLNQTLDVEANAGNLSIDSIDSLASGGTTFNIHENTGTLSFAETQKWANWPDTFNVLGNARHNWRRLFREWDLCGRRVRNGTLACRQCAGQRRRDQLARCHSFCADRLWNRRASQRR